MALSRYYSCKQSGSALILTFFFIVLLTMEVALIALIAQRSLGEEGIMLADNIQARRACRWR